MRARHRGRRAAVGARRGGDGGRHLHQRDRGRVRRCRGIRRRIEPRPGRRPDRRRDQRLLGHHRQGRYDAVLQHRHRGDRRRRRRGGEGAVLAAARLHGRGGRGGRAADQADRPQCVPARTPGRAADRRRRDLHAAPGPGGGGRRHPGQDGRAARRRARARSETSRGGARAAARRTVRRHQLGRPADQSRADPAGARPGQGGGDRHRPGGDAGARQPGVRRHPRQDRRVQAERAAAGRRGPHRRNAGEAPDRDPAARLAGAARRTAGAAHRFHRAARSDEA